MATSNRLRLDDGDDGIMLDALSNSLRLHDDDDDDDGIMLDLKRVADDDDDGIMLDLKRVAEERKSVYKPACMFPVGMLLNVKPEVYAPRVISLGLFNRSPKDAPKTKADQCRLEMACAFLKVMGKKEGDVNDWAALCSQVVPDPKAMRDLYDGIGRLADPLSDKQVQSALTLDAIFVTCFVAEPTLSRFFPAFQEAFKDPMAPIKHIVKSTIFIDLLNVENQIPIIVIEKTLRILLERLDDQTRVNLGDAPILLRGICERMGRYLQYNFVPGCDPEVRMKENVSYNFSEYNNLLDFAHQWVLSKDLQQPTTVTDGFCIACLKKIQTGCSMVCSCSCCILLIKDCSCGKFPNSSEGKQRWTTLPSVARLEGAGIEFRGFKGTFHDIRFTRLGLCKAILHLPQMAIHEDSVPMWRNLAAFEQLQWMGDVNRLTPLNEFTWFLTFMDNLIDDENDVLLLRKGEHPVICQNWLGTNKDVATAFNGVLENYSVFDEGTKWVSLTHEILEYYDKVPRRMYVEFIRTNFNKPWFLGPILAALLLLGATIAQTIFTILGYLK